MAKIYSRIKAEKKISEDVLVETARNETVIISKCEWDCKSDQVWGWCGVNNPQHKCNPDFVHIIGHDDNSYDDLLAAFRNNRIAGFARIVMVNQIHYDLLHWLRCCKQTVTSSMPVWLKNNGMRSNSCTTNISCQFLDPLVGHASDADSRQRKLHLSNSTSISGENTGLNMKIFHIKEGQH